MYMYACMYVYRNLLKLAHAIVELTSPRFAGQANRLKWELMLHLETQFLLEVTSVFALKAFQLIG